MGINNTMQLLSFGGGALVGVLIGMLYDIFRMVRLTISFKKTAVGLQDFLFCLLGGLFTFIYIMYYADGYIRYYVLFGEVLGFFVYMVTLSRVIIGFYKWVLQVIGKILRFIIGKIIAPICKVIANIYRKISKLFQKTASKVKRIGNKSKFNLKGNKILLYNLFKRDTVNKKDRKKWQLLKKKKPKEQKDKTAKAETKQRKRLLKKRRRNN